MSVLVVGISHKSAPMQLLEQVARDAAGVSKLIAAAQDLEHVREATVLSTCNRIEIYADVERFHGTVESLSSLLCEPIGPVVGEVATHLYVHYDDGAVAHLFNVTSGLDSMVVGESQILGQAREALRVGQEAGSIGHSLNALFQQALRIGKRSHAETDIDRAGPSVVSAGLERASEVLGVLDGRRVLIVGAGSMAAIAASTLAPSSEVRIANRTLATAQRLAETHQLTVVDLDEVPTLLGQVDLVVSCTGSVDLMITAEQVADARTPGAPPLAIVDLALPHDVDPAVAELAEVELISLATLAEQLHDHESTTSINGVREIVAEELGAFLAARRTATVTPMLVALRGMATDVVETETERLLSRMPALTEEQRAEVANAMRRIAEKLLHQPTVRVKELAAESGEVTYAEALARLFALDPENIDAVTRGEVR
ncbi:MAG TPA: glutamyl-tRNA reductase [Marmoricola sp.]|nr:glutamyl-tRNA reductase [Marmoricola sp.]